MVHISTYNKQWKAKLTTHVGILLPGLYSKMGED
jgi:hypothetical protein